MNSSMFAGERRWASARRGGMTVLGKVTVPKPINLPSQRLENHGLDPNFEIVPKGTIGWGSRSSFSGSNPWTASPSSPNTDGGTVSPSHLNGRPSSGGSGTRPSTSGSDRTQDPAPNVWTSSSRPSSSSGTLSSNQTSSSLRPRSAENRPNSSQLSRFAEPVSKTSAAWGSSATAERLGVRSLKEDNFSLSSRDFPTLGSEKDNLVKNVESDCRPSSASGTVQAKKDNISHADIKHGTVNTWRAESSPHAEDDINPNMEKWQGDPHQYFNPNNAPQHFEGWRGPPMNGPPGGWYGGRPRGPAFGARDAPGGFPMEPFPYYRPIPTLAGSQPVPPPGPRGPHPKNGDLYRAQMHEAYPRPGMPFRPNFYPGPPGSMPYEGYYGPPMGYCNNERPYMGMPTGPPVYNRYPTPPPDISNSHVQAAAWGPVGKAMSEQVEMGHLEDTHGPKRVPLNSNNKYEQEEGHWEQNVPPNISQPGKTRFPVSSRTNEWGAEEDTEEATIAKRMAPSENPSNSYGNRIHSGDGMKVKSFGGTHSAKGVDDSRTNKSDDPPSFPLAVPHLPVSGEREAVLPATTKNPALMHKIDGLNAKFRVSDGVDDSNSAYDRGEERTGPQMIDSRVANYTREVGNASMSSQRTPASRNYAYGPNEVTVPVGDNPIQTIYVASRRSYHGGNPRGDNRGKGRFNGQDSDGDGWRRKPLNTDSSSAITAPNNESTPNTHSHGPNYAGETSENSVDPAGKTEGDSVEVSDSADIQAQRAKMREIAKQRTLQLQMEEEERVREQKAKALAKLEELDRRKIAGEVAYQKGERTPIIGDIHVEQESHTIIGTVVAELKTNESGFNLVMNPAVAPVEADSSAKHAGKFIEVSEILVPVMHQKGLLESNASHLPRNENSEDGSNKKVVSQSDDGGTSRLRRAGYKHKQNNMSQQSLNERTVSSTTSEVQKDHIHAAAIADMHELPPSDTIPSDSNVLNAPNAVVDSQRKRIYRSNKPKPKLDEDPGAPALPPATSDISHGNESIDNNGGSNKSVPNLGASVARVSEPDRSVQTREVSSSLPSEESQSKVSNQWKPHLSRRIPKNQQSHRFTDKHHGSDSVVWAPKAKGSDELNQTSVQESANSKGNIVTQSSLKGKRAEMERYVPKPQLAQQGSGPPLSSVSSSRSNEGAGVEPSGSAISATENFKSNLEMNVGDSSHNKNKKDHETWRQRGSTDSSQMKGVNTDLRDSPQVKGTHTGPSPVFEPTNYSQQSKELVQFGTSEINKGIAETNIAGGNHTSMDTATAAANRHPSARDQGATGRGKRHPTRAPRSGGNKPDLESTLYSEVEGSSIQSSALDGNQMDKSTISKENRASPHWQRKSSPNSANNQQGSRNAGSESVASDTNRIPRKDNPQHKVQVVPQQDESSNTNQPFSQPDQYVNTKSNVAADSVACHNQDFDREKKPALAKGRPCSPNQDAAGSGESLHTNMDDQNECNVTSGSRRTSRPNNRPVRVHDAHREWSSGHDNRAHNPAFRERQRQNMHMEYQPVGPFKGHKPGKVDELGDGEADIMDQKHRERGQFHPKRGGNFYRR